MGHFDGAGVWITGGGSGIGLATALEFASRGARVAVSGRRQDRLDAAVAAIEAQGGEAIAVPCDVTDEASVTGAVAAVVEAFGGLDVVMANAGVGVNGRVHHVTEAEWQFQFDVNVLGAARTIRHAMPHLIASEGRMVLIGSVAGFLFAPKSGAYCASKAAVNAMGQSLSADLAQKGHKATCTTIHPGYVESEIARVDNAGVFDPEAADKRPKQLMWKADKAARVMVDAIYRRKRVFVFTGHGRLGHFLSRIAPTVTQSLIVRS